MEFAEAIKRPRVDNISLKQMGKSGVVGSLAVTSHHLIFSSNKAPSGVGTKSNTTNSKKEAAPSLQDQELWFLHKAIDVASLEAKQQNSGAFLHLKFKNFLVVTLDFSDFEDCQHVAGSIEILSNLADAKLEYPFFYRCQFTQLENGWKAFACEQEFARLQIHTDFWRISHVNKNFKVCSSYPEAVIVPKGISDEVLTASAAFREGARFPVLSYYHRETRSAVVRCSQPLVGSGNRRSREDEALINSLLGSSSRGYIIDTRSQSLAFAAASRGKGGGTEPDVNYPRWKKVYKPLFRWQQLQDSLAKLVEACHDGGVSSDRWLSRVGGAGWLQSVCDALTCSCVVAQSLDREEMSVVVHGAEGTDSTMVITSLVQVILDPDARTIRGFESLVEREWVCGGHPFRSRCSHAAFAKAKSSVPQEAPTFLFFLDCVWQIYQQFRCSFEFAEGFLVLMIEHAFASEFGTFLGNCEKEKQDFGVKENTVSLWSFVNRPEALTKHLNPFYEPNNGPIWPSVAPQSIELWERLFLRWSRDWSREDAVLTTASQWKTQEKDLMSKVIRLRRQLVELEREAQQLTTGQHSTNDSTV